MASLDYAHYAMRPGDCISVINEVGGRPVQYELGAFAWADGKPRVYRTASACLLER